MSYIKQSAEEKFIKHVERYTDGRTSRFAFWQWTKNHVFRDFAEGLMHNAKKAKVVLADERPLKLCPCCGFTATLDSRQFPKQREIFFISNIRCTNFAFCGLAICTTGSTLESSKQLCVDAWNRRV